MNNYLKFLLFILILSPMYSLAQTSATPGGYQAGPGSTLYKIYSHHTGPKIQQGNFISISAVGKTDGDSVLFNTYDSHPILTIVPKPQFKGDVFTMMQYLSEGDSATVKVPADSVFKVQTKPKGFKGKYLVYTIRINKVIAKDQLTDEQFQSTVKAYVDGAGERLKAEEPALINNYITAHKLNPKLTADSLYFTITRPGIGANAAIGDTVVMNYTGKLFNGKVFDSSIKAEVIRSKMQVDPTREYKPAHIVIDGKAIIPAWYEGLQLLNKGASAEFIVPSSLAYGKNGISIIAPYTPIIFDVTVIDIHRLVKQPVPAPAAK